MQTIQYQIFCLLLLVITFSKKEHINLNRTLVLGKADLSNDGTASVLISTQLQILLVLTWKKANSLECSNFVLSLHCSANWSITFALNTVTVFTFAMFQTTVMLHRTIHPLIAAKPGWIRHLCLGFHDFHAALPSMRTQQHGMLSHSVSPANPVSFSRNNWEQLFLRD